MKKFFTIILLLSMIFSINQTNAATINTSHCVDIENSQDCIKKSYLRSIVIQNTLIKNAMKNGTSLISSMDTFIKKYENSSEKINVLAIRAVDEIGWLSGATTDQKQQLLFEYILYKAQLTSIELNILASAKALEEESRKTYKLDLPDAPRNIADYLAIIGYLAEEEIGEYINDLNLKEKEKLAKKIEIKNEEIIAYFSFEERDVKDANAIEKNVYYRLLIFYEYLEDNPEVWEEYKEWRNQK